MAATPDASEVKSEARAAKSEATSGYGKVQAKSEADVEAMAKFRLLQPAPLDSKVQAKFGPLDRPKHTVSARRPLSEPASSRSKKASKPSQPSQQRQHSTREAARDGVQVPSAAREGLPLSTILSISAKQSAGDPDDDLSPH